MKERSQTFVEDSSCVVEYELSRFFMNYVRDNLFNKEIDVIMKSNELLETLSKDSQLKSSCSLDKNEESFYISRTLDTEITEEDDEPKIKSRPFTRRTTNGPTIQLKTTSNDVVLNCAIDEIKENCSRKTYSTVSILLENYNKLQKASVENKEKEQLQKNIISRRSQESNRMSEDQAITLAAKNMQLRKDNNELIDKIRGLEMQITTLNNSLNHIAKKDEEATNQKYKHIEEKHELVVKINDFTKNCHEEILSSLQKNLIEEGCNKCCSLMKRVKHSLINYKESLSQEIQTYERLWESQLNKPAIS